MKQYTTDELISKGYKIENTLIENVDISMADHGCITLSIALRGGCWSRVFGGCYLGHGYLGATKFKGSPKGIEMIAQIMNIVGVERFNEMKGKYIRVAVKSGGDTIKIIGNIIKNQWFDVESFFFRKYGGVIK